MATPLTIYDAPELHAALEHLLLSHVKVRAPDEEGQPRYWLPCDGCKNVSPAPLRVVSILCEECIAPCPHPDCGLLRHEHRDGCEPHLRVEGR